MTPDTLLWLVLGGLATMMFLAGGAQALRHFSRHELQELCRRGGADSLFGEILRRHDRVALAVESLLALVTGLVLIAGTYWMLARFEVAEQPRWPVLLASALVWGSLLAATTLWIPWAFAQLWAEPLLYGTWRFWRLLGLVGTPLVWFARGIDLMLHRLAGRSTQHSGEESFEQEIRSIVTEGHREGLLEEDAREMIEGVIELGEATVSEIMTPRTDLHMLRANVGWDEMLAYIIDCGHTRIPVYNKNRDDIVGILYTKDLLPELAKSADQPKRPLGKLLRKPHFVPQTKAVDDLLEEFQQTRNHMAIVLDEYGGVSGVVTIEDVLEEIVGEIVDEYDEEVQEEIVVINPVTCEALGRTHVDEINEQLGLHLPEDGEYDTIGGFVFSQLGRVPTSGETLEFGSLRITVLEATHRRIERLRIEQLGQTAQEPV